MKVSINVTLDIDPESWAMEYGIEGAAAIRADVKEHARQSLIEQYAHLGILGVLA